MTRDEQRRTSAYALLLMALGLGVIYHAGPWPWMSRSLTLAGSLAPALLLAGQMRTARRADDGPAVATMLIAALFLSTFLIQIKPGADPMMVYANYAVANVAAQCLLAGLWVAWARDARGEVIALVGATLAAIGAAMAAYVHIYKGLWLGLANPPEPWAEWRSGDYGAVDAFSRMATEMIPPEAFMMSLALAIWLLIVVRPWLRDRF